MSSHHQSNQAWFGTRFGTAGPSKSCNSHWHSIHRSSSLNCYHCRRTPWIHNATTRIRLVYNSGNAEYKRDNVWLSSVSLGHFQAKCPNCSHAKLPKMKKCQKERIWWVRSASDSVMGLKLSGPYVPLNSQWMLNRVPQQVDLARGIRDESHLMSYILLFAVLQCSTYILDLIIITTISTAYTTCTLSSSVFFIHDSGEISDFLSSSKVKTLPKLTNEVPEYLAADLLHQMSRIEASAMERDTFNQLHFLSFIINRPSPLTRKTSVHLWPLINMTCQSFICGRLTWKREGANTI